MLAQQLESILEFTGFRIHVRFRQDIGEVVGPELPERRQQFQRLGEFPLPGQHQHQPVLVGLRVAALALQPLAVPGLRLVVAAEALGLHPGAHELEIRAVRVHATGVLPRPVAGVGDAALGQGVGEQEFRWPGVTAGGRLHHLEHVGGAIGVEARPGQVLDTHPVGLLFVGTTELELILLGRRLGAGHRRHAGIAGARGDRHHTAQHAEQGGNPRPLLRLDTAGEVALADVGQFVGQDRRQFGLGLRLLNQAVVHAHHPARNREGVDGGVVHRNEFDTPIPEFTGFRQSVDQAFQIILQQRVFHRGHLAAERHQPDPAHHVFLAHRQHTGLAHGG